MKQSIKMGIVLVGIIVLAGCDKASDDQKQLSAILENDKESETLSLPADFNGIISSIEGNEIVIKNEVGKEILSEEDQAKRKAERQQITQEEKQALRVQEQEVVETQDVSLEIPVGTMISKGTGDGSGDSINAEYEELKKGSYISIWMNGDSIESIKIKGL